MFMVLLVKQTCFTKFDIFQHNQTCKLCLMSAIKFYPRLSIVTCICGHTAKHNHCYLIKILENNVRAVKLDSVSVIQGQLYQFTAS